MNIEKIVIIAGDAQLAEQVCSRLRRRDVYVPLIEAPMVRLVKYGIFDADCVRIGNIVRALQAETVFLLKVEPDTAGKLRGHLQDVTIVIADDFDNSLWSRYVTLRRPVGVHDLLTPKAGDYSPYVFVVEGEFAFSHVVAANLAAAHGGCIVTVAEVSDNDVDSLKDKFRTWSNGSLDEKNNARNDILEFIQTRLPKQLLASSNVQAVSFITRGVPYGVFPFHCPTTHYFSFPLLGISVVSGILKCESLFRCPVALLIDPDTVGQSEFEALRKTLGLAGYHLRLAYGDTATINVATYLCQYLPCDFIFFATHCGELDGKRIVERFPDRYGKSHEICYDVAVSISPSPGSDLFEAMFLYVPISVDGVSWADDEAKGKIKAGELLEDFLQNSKVDKDSSEKSDIVSSVPVKRVRGFDALRMNDGNYFPMPQTVGGFHYPVVFNNACCSWRSTAINFGPGGASVYIGTSTDVFGLVAREVGTHFINAVTSGKSIGLALYRAQKQFIEQFGYTPYLMHGYLYTKLANPTPRLGLSRVIQRMNGAITALERLPDTKKAIAPLTVLRQELSFLMGRRREK